MSTVRTAGTTPAGNAPRDRLRQRLAAARNKGAVDRIASVLPRRTAAAERTGTAAGADPGARLGIHPALKANCVRPVRVCVRVSAPERRIRRMNEAAVVRQWRVAVLR